MKRAIAIGITVLFLLQVFTGIRLMDEKDGQRRIAVRDQGMDNGE